MFVNKQFHKYSKFAKFIHTFKSQEIQDFHVDFIFCEKLCTVDQSTEDDDKNHTRILRPGGFKSTKSNCFDRI